MTGWSRGASFLEHHWPPLPALCSSPLGRSTPTTPRHCPHQPPDQSNQDQNPEQVDSPTNDMDHRKQYQPDDKDRQSNQQQCMNHHVLLLMHCYAPNTLNVYLLRCGTISPFSSCSRHKACRACEAPACPFWSNPSHPRCSRCLFEKG